MTVGLDIVAAARVLSLQIVLNVAPEHEADPQRLTDNDAVVPSAVTDVTAITGDPSEPIMMSTPETLFCAVHEI